MSYVYSFNYYIDYVLSIKIIYVQYIEVYKLSI